MDTIILFSDLDVHALGDRLLLARRKLGLSQEQVAWRADISAWHYGAIERGKAPRFSAATLWRLCQVLGVSADYLLGLKREEAV